MIHQKVKESKPEDILTRIFEQVATDQVPKEASSELKDARKMEGKPLSMN